MEAFGFRLDNVSPKTQKAYYILACGAPLCVAPTPVPCWSMLKSNPGDMKSVTRVRRPKLLRNKLLKFSHLFLNNPLFYPSHITYSAGSCFLQIRICIVHC